MKTHCNHEEEGCQQEVGKGDLPTAKHSSRPGILQWTIPTQSRYYFAGITFNLHFVAEEKPLHSLLSPLGRGAGGEEF
jgi:hypothetical protein